MVLPAADVTPATPHEQLDHSKASSPANARADVRLDISTDIDMAQQATADVDVLSKDAPVDIGVATASRHGTPAAVIPMDVDRVDSIASESAPETIKVTREGAAVVLQDEDVEPAAREGNGSDDPAIIPIQPTVNASPPAAADPPTLIPSALAHLPTMFQDAYLTLRPLLVAQMELERAEGWELDDLYAAEAVRKEAEERDKRLLVPCKQFEVMPPGRKVVRKTQPKLPVASE